jgi:hypothetical protein
MTFCESSSQLTVEFEEVKTTHLACDSTVATQYLVQLGGDCRTVSLPEYMLLREDVTFREYILFVEHIRTTFTVLARYGGLNSLSGTMEKWNVLNELVPDKRLHLVVLG